MSKGRWVSRKRHPPISPHRTTTFGSIMHIVILSGVPGCGKSTYIKNNFDKNEIHVVSADHFFEVNGEYKFDYKQLGEAHAACLREYVATLMDKSVGYLIVDNTNTSAIEMAPYVSLATAYGHTCEIVTLYCDPEIAAARNVHGVPLESIKRMSEAIDQRVIPRFWNVKVTEANHG